VAAFRIPAKDKHVRLQVNEPHRSITGMISHYAAGEQ
jgi:hypothetical protein